jgi:hypothetical protein
MSEIANGIGRQTGSANGSANGSGKQTGRVIETPVPKVDRNSYEDATWRDRRASAGGNSAVRAS